MRVCAAPAYLRAAGSPQSPADLTHHRAILYGRSDRPRSWLFPQPSGGVTEIIPPSRMHIDDVGAIRDAVLDSHGLAWLPCWLIRDDVESGRLVTVLDAVPARAFDSHALWPQTSHLPLRVRLAIDALAANLPPKVALAPRPSGSHTAHGSGS
jgi:DNA-binding transcriptional LysR family regulator